MLVWAAQKLTAFSSAAARSSAVYGLDKWPNSIDRSAGNSAYPVANTIGSRG